MSIVVFILLGLIEGAGVVLYFGWGVIGADMAGSLFNHIATTGLAGLSIANALVAVTAAAALVVASHAMFRDTRYRRRDPILIRSSRHNSHPNFASIWSNSCNGSKLSPRSFPQWCW